MANLQIRFNTILRTRGLDKIGRNGKRTRSHKNRAKQVAIRNNITIQGSNPSFHIEILGPSPSLQNSPKIMSQKLYFWGEREKTKIERERVQIASTPILREHNVLDAHDILTNYPNSPDCVFKLSNCILYIHIDIVFGFKNLER